MPESFAFDVFISYHNTDRAWARLLFDDLTARGVKKIFLDERRMKAGQPWEPQLAANASQSKYLVVLWSRNAESSDWVREETIRFKSVIDPNGTGVLLKDRQLYQILLQPKQSSTLTRYHAFTSLKDIREGLQPEQMSDAERDCWDAIVRDIAEAVIPPVPGIPWPVAVFAAIQPSLAVAPLPPPNFDGTFEEFLTKIGIPSYADFAHQYDARPEAWKPFGSGVPVSALLDNLLAVVNRRLAGNPAVPESARAGMRWQFVDLITTEFNRLDDEVRKLAMGPCLLIIDPLSLCFQRIGQRYTHLKPCFDNRHTTILWLTPFKPHEPMIVLRDAVKASAQPLIHGYYEPLPQTSPYGKCALNLGDEFELNRMILSAVAEMPMLTSVGAVSAVLSVGAKE